jgi:hypothetical protein
VSKERRLVYLTHLDRRHQAASSCPISEGQETSAEQLWIGPELSSPGLG